MEHHMTRRSHAHFLPSAAVALCGVAWGGFWYPLRWFESQGVGGAWVSFIFFAVSALSPLAFIWRRERWGEGIGGQLFTGFLLGSAFTLYTISLVMTDVIHAILLFYLTPAWSTIAGVIFLGERLNLNRGLALLMGFAGLAFILGVDDGLPFPRNAGDWIALISGMCWSAGTIRSFLKPSRSIAVTVFTFSHGGLVSSGIVLLIATGMASPIAATGHLAQTLPAIIGLALIIFVPPNFLVLWAAQRIDSGRVGILLMTEVLAGAITAALFSGEAFGVAELVGTILIVCAAVIEVLGRR